MIMSEMQKLVRCYICKKMYWWYAMTVAEQSACPSCIKSMVDEANRYTR